MDKKEQNLVLYQNKFERIRNSVITVSQYVLACCAVKIEDLECDIISCCPFTVVSDAISAWLKCSLSALENHV